MASNNIGKTFEQEFKEVCTSRLLPVPPKG